MRSTITVSPDCFIPVIKLSLIPDIRNMTCSMILGERPGNIRRIETKCNNS